MKILNIILPKNILLMGTTFMGSLCGGASFLAKCSEYKNAKRCCKNLMRKFTAPLFSRILVILIFCCDSVLKVSVMFHAFYVLLAGAVTSKSIIECRLPYLLLHEIQVHGIWGKIQRLQNNGSEYVNKIYFKIIL